jgi:hypothetical protein
MTTFRNISQHFIAIVLYNNLVLWRANSVCTGTILLKLKNNKPKFIHKLFSAGWGDNDVIWRHANLATIIQLLIGRG